jgi:hypothetical protein
MGNGYWKWNRKVANGGINLPMDTDLNIAPERIDDIGQTSDSLPDPNEVSVIAKDRLGNDQHGVWKKLSTFLKGRLLTTSTDPGIPAGTFTATPTTPAKASFVTTDDPGWQTLHNAFVSETGGGPIKINGSAHFSAHASGGNRDFLLRMLIDGTATAEETVTATTSDSTAGTQITHTFPTDQYFMLVQGIRHYVQIQVYTMPKLLDIYSSSYSITIVANPPVGGSGGSAYVVLTDDDGDIIDAGGHIILVGV